MGDSTKIHGMNSWYATSYMAAKLNTSLALLLQPSMKSTCALNRCSLFKHLLSIPYLNCYYTRVDHNTRMILNCYKYIVVHIVLKKVLNFSISAALRNLQSINFFFTLVTDIGLKKISGLSSMKPLNLDNRLITDTGLASLASMLLILVGYIVTVFV